MNKIEKDLQQELSNIFGVGHEWMRVIAGVVGKRATKMARSNNGLFEDIVADVTADIILQSGSGGLAVAIGRAKEASKTDAELVQNLRHVVMKATYYRVSDAMRGKYRKRTHITEVQATMLPSRHLDDDMSEYGDALVHELELMATAAEWQHKGRLAKRYRLAQEIVPDRLVGMNMMELMEKHDVASKATMQAILDDIKQALARLAGKLNDPTLLQGTKDVVVA